MLKYELIPEQLMHEGTITSNNLFAATMCADETILLTHTREYLDKLKQQTLSEKEQRHIGFPQSPQLTERELIITQGTIDCCHAALETGVALNIAGGTHHAFADRGEGFCLLNDFATAANYLLQQQLAKQILIVDLDVHQGNGTAKLFENNNRVYTFSMHMFGCLKKIFTFDSLYARIYQLIFKIPSEKLTSIKIHLIVINFFDIP